MSEPRSPEFCANVVESVADELDRRARSAPMGFETSDVLKAQAGLLRALAPSIRAAGGARVRLLFEGREEDVVLREAPVAGGLIVRDGRLLVASGGVALHDAETKARSGVDAVAWCEPAEVSGIDRAAGKGAAVVALVRVRDGEARVVCSRAVEEGESFLAAAGRLYEEEERATASSGT